MGQMLRYTNHAWKEDFFRFVVLDTGEFVAVDENIDKRKSLDVARILIRTKGYDNVNFVERFEINGELFVIKVVQDWYGPLQWNKRSQVSVPNSSSSDESNGDSDNEHAGGSLSGNSDDCGGFFSGKEEDNNEDNESISGSLTSTPLNSPRKIEGLEEPEKMTHVQGCVRAWVLRKDQS